MFVPCSMQETRVIQEVAITIVASTETKLINNNEFEKIIKEYTQICDWISFIVDALLGQLVSK